MPSPAAFNLADDEDTRLACAARFDAVHSRFIVRASDALLSHNPDSVKLKVKSNRSKVAPAITDPFTI